MNYENPYKDHSLDFAFNHNCYRGVCYSFFNSGLTVPWKYVGNPSEKISSILGFELDKLYVYTDSGEMYSLFFPAQYSLNFNESNPFPVKWVTEKNIIKDLPPIYQNGQTFKSPPLNFAVKQIYQFQFPEDEGSNVTKFALSEDGNLWYWGYGASVYPGYFFFFSKQLKSWLTRWH